MSSNKVLIFSAPSGAGKTTIVKHLLEQMPTELSFSISACSRKPRNNEIEGKDYYFLSVDEFKKNIAESKFLEWEEVYPHLFYGTLLEEVQRIWSQGKSVVFDVDVQGGISLKQHFGDKALALFVAPPSLEVLEKRLRNRGTESEEDLQKRIGKAEEEMTHKTAFDQVLVNENLETTCQEALTLAQDFLVL
jgi:guanylate kinase